jgi:methanogenic corrinoid protein MtbC1
MATVRREVRFDERLLARLEEHTDGTEEELSRVVNLAVGRYLSAPRASTPLPAEDLDLSACATAYRDAVLDGDARRAADVLHGALAAGADLLDAHCDIVAPALAEVGHRWAVDEVSVAEEHRATEITVALLAELAPERRVPATSGRLAVVTATPDELHVVGARMVADLLEREGWEVIFLGAATPARDLVELTTEECPDLVALSTSTAGRLPGVQEVLTGLAALDPRPVIAAGGPLYTEQARDFARALGADVVTSDLRRLREVLRERFAA